LGDRTIDLALLYQKLCITQVTKGLDFHLNVRYTLHWMTTKLCTRLKETRLAKGLTQEALADQLGVSRQTIIAIEKVKYVPSVKLALEIAITLGVSIDRLFWVEKAE